MKKYFLIYFIFFMSLVGCTNYKIIYNDIEFNSENKVVKELLEVGNATEKHKSILVFTAWFEKDTIKVLNNNKIIKEDVVNTTPQTGLGDFQVVSNNVSVEVQILSDKTIKIPLKQKHLQKYKFVYISRNVDKRNKFILEYSNTWKGFM